MYFILIFHYFITYMSNWVFNSMLLLDFLIISAIYGVQRCDWDTVLCFQAIKKCRFPNVVKVKTRNYSTNQM